MRKKIDKILGYFLAFLMLVMTIDVMWGVITRYIFGSQASWTEELARFLLIWIGILGAAFASGKKMHLAIDLLQPSLEEKNQKRLANFINILIIIFVFAIMIIGGIRLIYITNTLGQLSPALRVPMALIYGIVPVSGLLIVYYKISEIFGLGEPISSLN